MTVNVVLVTQQAIVFGCDSISSSSRHLLDPYGANVDLQRCADDPDKLTATFSMSDIGSYITNTWDGVTKIFKLHDGSAPVAAITAGVAKLNGKTMELLSHEFYELTSKSDPPLAEVEEIAKQYLAFLRKEYDDHYKDSNIDESFKDGPEFLVGGYGYTDAFPCLYKVRVKENTVEEEYSGGGTGLSWNGVAHAVQRWILGYDGQVFNSANMQHLQQLQQAHELMKGKLVQALQEAADNNGIELPENLEIDLTLPPPELLTLGDSQANIAYDALPTQSGIDLVSELVNLQSAASRFESGIPVVGGRTRIGIITKTGGLQFLSEPELKHDHTGA